MILYGITGGIGMGKSAVGEMLTHRGIPVEDSDAIARRLVQPGQPALKEIADCFGREILAPDGTLLREQLARIVFSDPERRGHLESILHPRIRREWTARIKQWRHEGSAAAAILIPLLFETGAAVEFDCVICVACSVATQHERLSARGWSDEVIKARNAAQWPVEVKMDRASLVIWTEGEMDVTAAQVNRVMPNFARRRR